jgi:hypothetical protein
MRNVRAPRTPRNALVGHIATSATDTTDTTAPVRDSDVIASVFTIRRAIVTASRLDVRAIQSELAYLRRLARRQLRRAS